MCVISNMQYVCIYVLTIFIIKIDSVGKSA